MELVILFVSILFAYDVDNSGCIIFPTDDGGEYNYGHSLVDSSIVYVVRIGDILCYANGNCYMVSNIRESFEITEKYRSFHSLFTKYIFNREDVCPADSQWFTQGNDKKTAHIDSGLTFLCRVRDNQHTLIGCPQSYEFKKAGWIWWDEKNVICYKDLLDSGCKDKNGINEHLIEYCVFGFTGFNQSKLEFAGLLYKFVGFDVILKPYNNTISKEEIIHVKGGGLHLSYEEVIINKDSNNYFFAYGSTQLNSATHLVCREKDNSIKVGSCDYTENPSGFKKTRLNQTYEIEMSFTYNSLRSLGNSKIENCKFNMDKLEKQIVRNCECSEKCMTKIIPESIPCYFDQNILLTCTQNEINTFLPYYIYDQTGIPHHLCDVHEENIDTEDLEERYISDSQHSNHEGHGSDSYEEKCSFFCQLGKAIEEKKKQLTTGLIITIVSIVIILIILCFLCAMGGVISIIIGIVVLKFVFKII